MPLLPHGSARDLAHSVHLTLAGVPAQDQNTFWAVYSEMWNPRSPLPPPDLCDVMLHVFPDRPIVIFPERMLTLFAHGDVVAKAYAAGGVLIYVMHPDDNKFVLAGGMRTVVELVQPGVLEDDAYGTANLVYLLAACSIPGRADILASITQAGTVESVVRFLVDALRGGDAQMKTNQQRFAAGALLNLMQQSVDIPNIIESIGTDEYYQSGGAIIDILLCVLRYEAGGTLLVAMDVVRNVVRDVRTFASALIGAGAVPILVQLIMHARNDETRHAAAAALADFETKDYGAYSKAVADVVPDLIESLRTGDAEGKALAASVLGTLGGDVDAAAIALRAGAVELLLEHLRLGDAAVRLSASNALTKLATDIIYAEQGSLLIRLLRIDNGAEARRLAEYFEAYTSSFEDGGEDPRAALDAPGE
jgi:hypothetical protein